MECLRLRVKDIDVVSHHIAVRDGKGHKDRVTMLLLNVQGPLQRHLDAVTQLHTQDLQAGGGHVYLPYALDRKYPNTRAGCPRVDGVPDILAKQTAVACQTCPSLQQKRVTPHVLRHPMALAL